MDKRGKHRIIFAVPALLAFLAAAWVLGNLLLDVKLSGHNEDRKETPLPAPAGATLRDVFETIPRKGGPDSRIELLEGNTEAWAARRRLLAEAHATPGRWKDVKRYWTLLRIAKKLPGTSRLLWK